MNPIWHSESAVKQWGGIIEDYLPLHEKMDVSKMYFSDNRHRALTHTMFWVNEVMLPIFGSYITNSEGKKVSVKDICERHILEDYKMKFIPTVQDFLENMEFLKWMQNGNCVPNSAKKLYPELVEIEKQKEEKPIRLPNPEITVLDGNRGGGGYRKFTLD